jgi:hypothetical protein
MNDKEWWFLVGEYLPDHHRVFDTGDDADITTTFTAGLNEDV